MAVHGQMIFYDMEKFVPVLNGMRIISNNIKWTEEQKAELEKLLGLADSVEYVSDRYYNGCMKDRNARLVELATVCCISYWNPNNFRSGTGQTVRMAQKKGIRVINLFESGQTPINRP